MLAFEVANGTIVAIDGEAHDAARACTLLIFVFCVAVVLNVLVVITVFRSFLRSHAFNMILAAVCAACLLDALINVPLAAVFRSSWTDLYRWVGGALLWCCRFSCAFSHTCLALQVSGTVLLGAHRLAELPQRVSGSSGLLKTHSYKRYNWMILMSWLGALTTVFPAFFGLVDVGYFQERYSCGYVNVSEYATSLAAAVSQMTFGHIVPYLAMIGIWSIIIWRIWRERQRLLAVQMVAMQRAAALSSPVRGLGSSQLTWNLSWTEGEEASAEGSRNLILCGLLTAMLLTFILPGWIYTTITQFELPAQLPNYHLMHWTSIMPKDLRPLRSSWVDNTFTWMRFIYNLVVPIVIISLHPPLRLQMRAFFKLCSRRRFSAVQSVSGYLNVRQRARNRKKSKFQQLFDEFTPVLFVTNDGLHVRQSVESNIGYFVPVFADLCVKLPGEGVKKLTSPKKSLKRELWVHDEEEDVVRNRKPGKTVRFSQGVKEIPENLFGSSRRVDPFEAPSVVNNFTQLTERRNSEPVIIRGKKEKSLEMELANASFASSSSLLLSFSQRLRKRDS